MLVDDPPHPMRPHRRRASECLLGRRYNGISIRGVGGRRTSTRHAEAPDAQAVIWDDHGALGLSNAILAESFDYASSRSLPFLASCGSVHAERLKQQGLRFPLFIFEMLTSIRRLRVSGLLVAFTQRTHSQRAIGVMSIHTFWIF